MTPKKIQDDSQDDVSDDLDQDDTRQSSGPSDRQMYDAVCAECGAKCQVPFKPDPDRAVYCRECWQKKKNQRSRY
ncbi:hypothetical protein COY23_01160 [bacterium (Candidatus Torokbacteria) CG_4_10_14_0_2_um_filter_35_8]|nr:MAG: hypothetical protein COY23_01160 [bacterium (Candidatus Torokbacteria) CG_4_10_14_0_2_um_filter_35_8]